MGVEIGMGGVTCGGLIEGDLGLGAGFREDCAGGVGGQSFTGGVLSVQGWIAGKGGW